MALAPAGSQRIPCPSACYDGWWRGWEAEWPGTRIRREPSGLIPDGRTRPATSVRIAAGARRRQANLFSSKSLRSKCAACPLAEAAACALHRTACCSPARARHATSQTAASRCAHTGWLRRPSVAMCVAENGTIPSRSPRDVAESERQRGASKAGGTVGLPAAARLSVSSTPRG